MSVENNNVTMAAPAKMSRRTVVIPDYLAWSQERYQAAEQSSFGLQIMTPSQLASRLAGGFSRLASREVCHSLVGEALAGLDLAGLGKLREMPGAVGAICGTLAKVWDADLDLNNVVGEAVRIRDLAGIESYLRDRLPTGMLLQRDLVSAAIGNLRNATFVLGAVVARGFVFVAPCWQRLFLGLAASTTIEWYSSETAKQQMIWAEGSSIRVAYEPKQTPKQSIVVCATPKHEVLESLRWAREIIVSGRAHPHEIAIAASATEEWDDDFRVLAADSQLPVHFVNGRAATSTFPGQQAGSLAAVLLQGLSRDRVVQALRLLHNTPKLRSLPGNWYAKLSADAPLLKYKDWQRSLAELAEGPEKIDLRLVLLPILDLLSKGAQAAEQVGEELLSGQSRAIWRRALIDGPAPALMTTIAGLRVPDDDGDPNVSITWGPARILASTPRPFTRLLGLTSRHWPRQSREDALLPSHVLSSALLERASVTLKDRTFLAVLRDAAREIVYSRSRRDSEGRLLGTSPLMPSDVVPEHLQRSRTPPHAFSESDRLLAQPQEFSEREQAKSSLACYQNWRSHKITSHDGLLNSGHPVIEDALKRLHSATSLELMLTDPLGFVWRYALGWKLPSLLSDEEPLILDKPTYGTLVHDVLRLTVALLESGNGFLGDRRQQIELALTRASHSIAHDWELTKPIPPERLWRRTLGEASSAALSALTWSLPLLNGQRSYVEVPFGGMSGLDNHCPWDRDSPVVIPETDLKLWGKIDRLDLDADSTEARVIDYKTGRCPDKEPGLNHGKELQRCLYAVAVKALLPNVPKIQTALLYPGPGGMLFLLADPNAQTQELIRFLHLAEELIRSGQCVFGTGAETSYNDLAFALPANAEGVYFRQKTAGRDAAVGELCSLWGEN